MLLLNRASVYRRVAGGITQAKDARTGVAAELSWSRVLRLPDADAIFICAAKHTFTPAGLAGAEPKLIIHHAALLGELRLRSA
jgi:hypothetical protein